MTEQRELFCVLFGRSPEELEKKVNLAMEGEWEPVGGITLGVGGYCQSMKWVDRKTVAHVSSIANERRSTPFGCHKANDEQYGGNHYKQAALEPWDAVIAWGLGFFDGNAVKYLARWRKKGGVEDLLKARHYIDKLLEQEVGE